MTHIHGFLQTSAKNAHTATIRFGAARTLSSGLLFIALKPTEASTIATKTASAKIEPKQNDWQVKKEAPEKNTPHQKAPVVLKPKPLDSTPPENTRVHILNG